MILGNLILRKLGWLTLLFFTGILLLSPAWGVVPYRASTFQNLTTDNWSGGADPTVIPQDGPLGAGDAYLQITSTGTLGPGANPATNNISENWIGNYAAANLRWLLVEMRSPITSAPLEIRAVLHGTAEGGTRLTSTTSMTVQSDGVWRKYEFSLAESDLVRVSGSDSYATVFSAVERIMIRHNPGMPTSGGTPLQAVWHLDNIRLVPDVGCNELGGVVNAIASGGSDLAWDLNSDAVVNQADLSEMLAIAGRLRLPSKNPILPGDANLDGVVDGSDFGIWNANKFTSIASWCAGDFNADGVVDGSDFGIWNARKFTSADATSLVPEPSLAIGMGILFVAVVLGSRR
jgi:hypothetical protein